MNGRCYNNNIKNVNNIKQMKFLILVLLIGIIESQPKIVKELPDRNRDGLSDSYDLLEAFRHTQHNQYEIQDIMYLADKNNDGLVSRKEWETFYKVFVEPFNNDCDTNGDLLLDKGELETCIAKLNTLQSFNKAYQAQKADKKAENIMMALSANQQAINFSHYLFIRKTGFVFKQCVNATVGNTFITRQEVQDCALSVLMQDHNINTENYLFTTASLTNLMENIIQPEDKGDKEEEENVKQKQGYSATGTVNLFWKVNLFNRVSAFKSDL